MCKLFQLECSQSFISLNKITLKVIPTTLMLCCYIQKFIVLNLDVNRHLISFFTLFFYQVTFMLIVTVKVLCVCRYCARLQCVPHPQYHSVDVGGAVRRAGPYLQQEEQHTTERWDTVCGSRYVL